MGSEEVFASCSIFDENTIARILAFSLFANSGTVRTNPTSVIASAAMRRVVLDPDALAFAKVFP